MNRQTLAESTSLHDGSVPIYLLEEIANQTKFSVRDAEKIADYLVGRATKTNHNVKYKALQVMQYCIREGHQAFLDAIRDERHEIEAIKGNDEPAIYVWNFLRLVEHLETFGTQEAATGNEKTRQICRLVEGIIYTLDDEGDGKSSVVPVAYQDMKHKSGGHMQQNFIDIQGAEFPEPPKTAPHQNTWSAPVLQHLDRFTSGGSFGSSSLSRQDNRSSSFGQSDSQNAITFPEAVTQGPNRGSARYTYSNRDFQNEQAPLSAPSGYNLPQHSENKSWSSVTSSTPQYTTGTWNSSGFKKKEMDYSKTPRSSRENRPTVLIGHRLNVAKPVESNLTRPYNLPPPASAGNTDGRARQLPTYMENTDRLKGTAFAAPPPKGWEQKRYQYESRTHGIHSRIGGFSSATQHSMVANEDSVSSKLNKTVEGLVKMSLEAREKWDCRNMDKSMATSLADHDELTATAHPMDLGYYQQSRPMHTPVQTDIAGEYERGLIESLCVSTGLARAPPAEELIRFVELAQNLEVDTIGEIILDKLEDSIWQVRLKALYVILALFEASACTAYVEWFEENSDVIEALVNDEKPPVVSKALQILRFLGLAGELEHTTRNISGRTPPSNNRKGLRYENSNPVVSQRSKSTAAEADLLGFNSSPVATRKAPQQNAPFALTRQPEPSPQNISLNLLRKLLDQFLPQSQLESYPSQAPHSAQNIKYNAFHQKELFQKQAAESLNAQPLMELHAAHPTLSFSQPPINSELKSTSLSQLGKDLFSIANSPRAVSKQPSTSPGEECNMVDNRSAFSFM
uniref:Uncharacterized protein AlNc14C248G9596 n=1 Tax=Albugo laibachii Nc14 TaxID=890382 RepID=F0WTB1_9STRA|nr:conserved hypothetical protein [Albugo laibachii Nc14]|eukprot:CCA24600.1 conserved hypothetical protein [Albugo laibachii Nc14]